MLSNEEKKAIEYLKIEYEKLMKEDNILFPLYKSDAKKLIDIIEKQSKEIEELKLKNEALGDITLYNQKNNDKKWEDKIKAKIEEIENTGIDVAWEQINYTIREQDRAKIEVLQSLLEKE